MSLRNANKILCDPKSTSRWKKRARRKCGKKKAFIQSCTKSVGRGDNEKKTFLLLETTFSPVLSSLFSLEGTRLARFPLAMKDGLYHKLVHPLTVIAFLLAFCGVAASRVARDFLSVRARLQKGGDQATGGEEKQGVNHCSLVLREYHSSKLEQAWLDNARKWSEDFCSHMGAFLKETQRWLDTIAAVERDNGGSTHAKIDDDDNAVFSSFVSVYDCSVETVTKKTWIEPLSHGLRHPRALCGGGVDLVDRAYLLLSFRDDFFSLGMAEDDRGGFLSSEAKGARADSSSSRARSNHAAASSLSSRTQGDHAAGSLLSSRTQGNDAVHSRVSSRTQSNHAADPHTTSNGMSTRAADSHATRSTTSATQRHDLGGACAKRPCQNIFVDLGAST